jgi:uncharacterized protein
MNTPKQPRIDLKLIGDWGNANFHLVAGLVTAHMRWRSERGSTFWIKTGTGSRDNLEAVATGDVDVGITTPFNIALEWGRTGSHFFNEVAYPNLRALGYYPHDDRIVFAVRADLGISSFEDIRRKKPALKIATTFHDPDNMLTWVIDLILKMHGIDPSDIERWGGSWHEHDHPRKCLPQVTNGVANAVFHEGIMVPEWHELVETVPMRFIPMEEQVLARLKQEYGLRPAILSKGRLRADRDIPCLDWSNWAVIVNESMPNDLAYRVTSILVEERAEIEGRYRSLPLERSPLTYPINPNVMWKDLGGSLHPGAERYYREHGYMR